MEEVEIKLRRRREGAGRLERGGRRRYCTGWFFSGDAAESWLEELGRCGGEVEWAEVGILPLPGGAGSAGSGRCGGALVVSLSGRELPGHPGAALRYGNAGPRCWTPLDGEMEPWVSEEEMGRLVPEGRWMVFCAGIGRVEFAPGDMLGVWEFLLVPGSERGTDWTLGRPGLAAAREIVALEALVVAEAEAESGPERAGDPGKGAEKMDGTEETDEERRWPGWLQWLHKWLGVEENSGKIEEIDGTAAEREAGRLLRLLEEDVEAGLRAAPALWKGPEQWRGFVAAASGRRLRERTEVEFSLARVRGAVRAGAGGGGAAPLGAGLRWRLEEKYRQIARREERLGRWRRAAYVYGELLGDFAEAARVLRAGGFLREAGMVTRDFLKRTAEAAECFEEGRFFSDALEIYEREGRWLDAGRMERMLGRPERAAAHFRREVDRRTAEDDPVGAAAVLREQLYSPDEAVLRLEAGWPGSRQAGECVEQAFALLGELGRTEAAADLVERLRAGRTRPGLMARLAGALGRVAVDFPDAQVRRKAADAARVTVGRRLADAEGEETAGLLAILTRLEPGDERLAADAARWLAMAREG